MSVKRNTKKFLAGVMAFSSVATIGTMVVHADTAETELVNPTYRHTFEGEGLDYLRSFSNSPDGGYLIGGDTGSKTGDFIAQSKRDGLIIKFDKYGKQQWKYQEKLTTFYKIISTKDGGYIGVGSTLNSMGTLDNGYMVKLDANGKKLWSKERGNLKDDNFHSVTEDKDGNIYVVGKKSTYQSKSNYYYNTTNYMAELFTIKYSPEGTKLWEKKMTAYGMSSNSTDITVLQDGSVAIIGTINYPFGDFGGMFAKGSDTAVAWSYDSNGNLTWKKVLDGRYANTYVDMISTKDGGFIAVGSDNISFNSATKNDMKIVKVNANGAIVWEKLLVGSKHDALYNIVELPNGHYLVQGTTASTDRDFLRATPTLSTTLFLAEIDNSGNILNKRYILDSDGKWLSSTKFIRMDDGGYLISPVIYDLSLLKIDGNIMDGKGMSDTQAPTVLLHQNIETPTNQSVTIEVTTTDEEGGSGVKSITLPNGNVIQEGTASYTVEENGAYTFTVSDNAGNLTTETITIDNIDKDIPESPTFSISPSTVSFEEGADIGSGAKEVQVSINHGGFFSYTEALNLPDGQHEIVAKTVDYAGNESKFITLHVTMYGEQLEKAEKSVEQAQNEYTQTTIDSAVYEISELPNSAVEKQTLSEQVVNVQEQVTNTAVQEAVQNPTVENYEKALESIESLQETTQSLPVSTETVTKTEQMVSELNGAIHEVEEDLIVDNSNAYGKAIGDAIRFINKAEGKPNKGLIQVTQKKIDALEDGAVKNSLQKRLNALK